MSDEVVYPSVEHPFLAMADKQPFRLVHVRKFCLGAVVYSVRHEMFGHVIGFDLVNDEMLIVVQLAGYGNKSIIKPSDLIIYD